MPAPTLEPTRLDGRVAIVTGGGSGIGRALCEELARRRAAVIVADLSGDEAARVAQAVVDAGGVASAAPVDVADTDSLRELVRATVARHGRIDLLFNNAGVGWTGRFQEMDTALADRLVAINLKGVAQATAAVYPIMVSQGAGHIVNTSSFLSGLIPVPGKAVYSATKHAIVGFSLSLREEARLLGVRVSVVCPSYIRTGIDRNSARILGGRVDAARPAPPGSGLDAAAVAKAILEGVSRNKAIVIMPPFVRPVWWLHRASPWLSSVLCSPLALRKLDRKPRSRAAAVGLGPARWLFRKLMHGRGKPHDGA